MAIIYATLIVKGKENLRTGTRKIEPQVKQVLIDLECEDRSRRVSHGINHAVHICALGFMGAWDQSLYCFPEHIINYPNS